MTDQPQEPYYRFTVESLAKGGRDFEAVERWFESEIDRLDKGYTYDDLLDLMEKDPWWDENGQRRPLDLGTSTDSPVYRRLLAIARRIRRETR